MKQKRHYDVINMCIFLLVILFVAWGWGHVKENRAYLLTDLEKREIKPIAVQTPPDGSTQYLFDIIDESDVTFSLMFYTSHQEVHVYVQNELIYYNEKVDSIFGHSTGSEWHLVKVPRGCRILKVRLSPVYSDTGSAGQPTFFYGDGRLMFEQMIVSSFPAVVICVLIISLGLCLLIFYFLVCRSEPEQHNVLDLGVFAFLLGVWAFGETTGAIVLLKPRVMASYTAYTCLMFLGIPFILFIRNFLKVEDKYLHKLIIGYCLVMAVTCQTLQFLGIRDIKQNVIWIHLVIAFLVIYSVYASVRGLIKKQNRKRILVNAIGLSIMILSSLLDLQSYYSDRVNANQAGKMGFLIYIVILGVVTAQSTQMQMNERRKLNFYQELALMDMQTNCYNRNAYNEDCVEFDLRKSSQIVTFDLNNLKKCNDILGHNNGDAYIVESAELIKKIFGKYGKVYRIGGDEFCVLSHKLSIAKIKTLIERLNQEEKECTFYHMGEVPLRIACGYAEYDSLRDRTLEETRNRADEEMYKNKKDIKAGQ